MGASIFGNRQCRPGLFFFKLCFTFGFFCPATCLHSFKTLAFQLEGVLALLDGGADVARAARGGFSPMVVASVNGHAHIVRLLIERGADVRVASKFVLFKPTALHLAAFNGHDAVVRELLCD